MSDASKILAEKLRGHSLLSNDDLAAIRLFPYQLRELSPNEDLIRQGDDPSVSVLVVRGVVGRYHLLENGRRQYLSFHLMGDLPDAQALFLDHMDHAVCAMGHACVALIPHKNLLRAFEQRPKLGFAVWRETLIDAAIFREAITNNSSRPPLARMAHLFCELFYRAEASSLTQEKTLELPISLVQWADTLGMRIATVNRALALLRSTRAMEFRNSRLSVRNWRRMKDIGQFDPGYLHLRKSKQPSP
ncbi:Crp/Fnr family transcriptional regulator [Bradyrhizobium sp.]|uniref:Crp/Fnr family transcriptional regulator n=1 Tax=Bradyrhizobium sp. TaxID=376 RepID=UPI003C46D7C6